MRSLGTLLTYLLSEVILLRDVEAWVLPRLNDRQIGRAVLKRSHPGRNIPYTRIENHLRRPYVARSFKDTGEDCRQGETSSSETSGRTRSSHEQFESGGKSSRRKFSKRNLTRTLVGVSTAAATNIIQTSPVRSVASEFKEQIKSTKRKLRAPPTEPLPDVGENKKRIYFVRHGQTNFNNLKICQGRRLDPPLNGNGREQARRLLPRVKLDAIMCSPMRRARETASIVLESHPDASLTVLDDLNEVDFGGAEGLPQPLAAAILAPSYFNWSKEHYDVRAGWLGDSGLTLQQRVGKAVAALLSSCSDGGQVLAVSHSSMIKFTLAAVLDVPLPRIRAIGQSNCAVNALDFDMVSGEFDAIAINDQRVEGRRDRLSLLA